MLRRFCPVGALVILVSLFGTPALADDAPVRAPTANVSLLGGVVSRTGTLAEDPANNAINEGTRWGSPAPTPTFFRLRADAYFLRWLGVEVDALIDHSVASPEGVMNVPDSERIRQTRTTARGALAGRLFFDSGFHFGGSLGWAVLTLPIIRYPVNATVPLAENVLVHGPAARLGIGFTRGFFDGALNAQLIGVFGNRTGAAFDADLFLGWRFYENERTALTVGLDYGVLAESGSGYSATAQRITIGFKVTFLPERSKRDPNVLGPEASKLEIAVVLPDGAPAVGAKVRLDALATTGTADGSGQVISAAPPGRYFLTATLDGFREGHTEFTVNTGDIVTPVTIRLESLSGPGSLSGVISAAASKQPVAGATVTIDGVSPVTTATNGSFAFKSAGPGPVRVRVEAQGFATVEEVVQVPAERSATLDVPLEALGKGSPATVRGLIRSRNGEPINAQVSIRGVSVKVPVTAEGRFVVTLKGGTYSFTISAPGYQSQTKRVVLADGDQAIFHCELLKGSR